MLRAAHEAQLLPLRSSLKHCEEEIGDLRKRQLGASLVAEQLHTAAAQRALDSEQIESANTRAAASELRAAHAAEHMDTLKSHLMRREVGFKAIKKSLSAAHEELALMRSSKEVLAARHDLLHELARHRDLVSSEQVARSRAVATSRTKQHDAVDSLTAVAGSSLSQAHWWLSFGLQLAQRMSARWC